LQKTTGLNQLISLKTKKALITGCASGIGRAIALRFAESGANLILVDMNPKGLEDLKQQLSSYNVEIDLFVVDLSNKQQIDLLWRSLKGKDPDILINNVGIYPMKNFLEVDEAFFNNTLQTNLTSVFWMSQHMIERNRHKGGVIVNIGSIEAILPFKKDLAHYNLSKAGVIALTRTLAKEYGKLNFRINVILPGGIMTPGIERLVRKIYGLKLDLLKEGLDFRRRIPLGRFGEPDEVAKMTLVLSSDLASYVNGAIIAVDGGFLSA
jgi:NAD(P)-dependent dehydrogenase (short-subunit alcohol dehydrogenase family)